MAIYSLWHTGHEINHRVMSSFKTGFVRCEQGNYPLKHVSEYKGERYNISYGFIRGTDEIFKLSDEWWEIDRGYFGAGHFDGYYRLSKDGLRAPYRRMAIEGICLDRLRALGLNIRDWGYDKAGYVLVVPPTEAVSEFTGVDIGWGEWVAETIGDASNIPVKIRTKGGMQSTLRDDLARARLVIAYNSNVAIDALLAGVPAVAFDGLLDEWMGIVSLEDVLSGKDMTRHMETGEALDRVMLFNWLANNQFTLAEFESGFAWKHANIMQGKGVCFGQPTV